MIGRIWHGWTRPQNAEAYQRYLEGEILADIRSRREGFKGAYVLRREDRDQVEFLTLTLWDRGHGRPESSTDAGSSDAEAGA